jgi:drug/metabolite transporter (DMT)-like permease
MVEPGGNLRGALLLVAAMLIFTIEAAIVRWFGNEIQTMQAVLFRAVGQFAVVFAWAAWRGRWPQLRSQRMGLHIARGLVSIVGWWAYYLTFQKLNVGLATLLTFASSLFVVVLARPVLGERVRAASWIATIAGFAGIAIASDVLSQRFDPFIWVGMLSAVLSAAIVFLTRSLAQSEDTVTIMAWIGVFVLPASAIAAALDWQPIALSTMALLLFAGTFGAFGMVLMIEAYSVAEAGTLAPIPYIRIAFAILIGWWVFGEVPTLAMLLGSIIVIASALFAMRAERR